MKPRQITAVLLTDPSEPEELTAFRSERLRNAIATHPGMFAAADVVALSAAELQRADWPAGRWLFVLKPGDIPVPTVFEHVAVALDGYDAAWGATLRVGGSSMAAVSETAFGCTTLAKLLFRSPEHWLGRSLFVRGADARRLDTASLLDIWREGRATKLALPFVARSGATDDPALWADIIGYVRTRPVVERLVVEGEPLSFRIAYWNPIIERFLALGRLFEDGQLLALKRMVRAGSVIVDVGANIGQHAMFFARVMKASRVVAIEPNPDFAAILRENVALNEAANVDLGRLGIAVGAEAGRCRIAVAPNPQDTLVIPDPAGDVPMRPLDELVSGDVDLVKIDVDEQEIAVLSGMTTILSKQRPVLAVEVVHRNLNEALRLLDRFGYRVDHLFSNPQYHDLVAVPAERR